MMKKWIQCNLNILFNDSDGRIRTRLRCRHLHQKDFMSRASKKWEEWKKDPKLKAIAEKKEKEAKLKLDRKMQFNSKIREYEKYAAKIHEGALGNEWKVMDQDEAGDISVESGYLRIIFVFIAVVSVITGSLYLMI